MCSSQKNLRALIKDWLYSDITDGRTSSVVSYRIKQDHVRNSQPVWGHMQIDHVTRSISWPFVVSVSSWIYSETKGRGGEESLIFLQHRPASPSYMGDSFWLQLKTGRLAAWKQEREQETGRNRQKERRSWSWMSERCSCFIWNLLHIFPTSLNSSPNCKLRAAAASVTVSLTHTVAPECTTGSPRCLIFPTSTWTTSTDSFNINWSVCKPADSGCS